METKEEKKTPERQISVNIGANTYNIKFPNNGQIIDMERMKIQMSEGTQKGMLNAATPSSQQAYLLIEAIATFTILIPELGKDLTVRSLLELDPMQSKKLVSEYAKKFYPWFQEWMEEINKRVEGED